MFSNLIDTRYQADYRLMASSWMRNIWESHLLQINKSSEKLNKCQQRAKERADSLKKYLTLAKRTHYMRSPPLSRWYTADIVVAKLQRRGTHSQVKHVDRRERERAFTIFFRDLHNHDKERDARRRSFGLHSISYWFDRRCRETTSRLTKEARGVFLCVRLKFGLHV